ncbi:MAG TPA: type II CAAX endopeptidase family protein [Actinomycetota bacterium]
MSAEDLPPRPDLLPAGGPQADPARVAGPWGLRAPWGFWESLLVGVAGFLIGGVLAVPVVLASNGDELTGIPFALASLLGEIGLFVAVAGWLWIRHRRSIPALAIRADRPVDLAIGFGAGLLVYPAAVILVATLVDLVLRQIAGHGVEAPDQLPSDIGGGALVLTALVVTVAAPVAEELLFRGLLFRSIRDRHGFWPAAVVSSALFGLVHWQGSPWEASLLLVVTLAFVGLALAAIYEWRRNLLANMAAHCAFNVVGFTLFVLSR